jgi:HEAT repeat protein
MALTTEQLRALLDPEEPNYSTMATLLAPDDLEGLAALVKGPDPMLASKAAYAMTLIPDEATVTAVKAAVASPHEVVRIAFAAGLPNLGQHGVDAIALQLLEDTDPGVRKTATKTAGALEGPSLVAKLRSMAEKDPEAGIRALAKAAVEGKREA